MRSWWKTRRVRMRGDRGGLELFYAGVVVIAFLLIGLVIDGGLALDRMSNADYVAQQAARAGAQQVDPAQAITGEAIVIDPGAAQAAARSYLAAEGIDGDVQVSGDGLNLSVTVHDTHHPIFVSLLGIGEMSITGHGESILLHEAEG
ncbi:pilus assembly protein TadG-related protein [Streptomyces albidoflavus]|uniref:pilus assembly protein TadG-related protein n=1 Tax=Streptomyces albidoflavus TaxID=1886 RepID=UPI003445FD35